MNMLSRTVVCRAAAILPALLAITALGAAAAEPPKSEKTANPGTHQAGGPVTLEPSLPSLLQGPVKRVTPATGIQGALDEANPGDMITLAPGVYYESIIVKRGGTSDRPVVIRAEKPGTATISGGTPPDFKLKFNPGLRGKLVIDKAIYGVLPTGSQPAGVAAGTLRAWAAAGFLPDGKVTNVTAKVAGMVIDDTLTVEANSRNFGDPAGGHEKHLMVNYTIGGTPQSKTVRVTETLSIFPESTASVPWPVRWVMADGRNLVKGNITVKQSSEGFSWSNNTLTVSLMGQKDPNEARMEIHREGAKKNVMIQAGNVILEGLRLHLAPDVGVQVSGDHVTIRDCHFTGTALGIKADEGTKDVTVEHCEYSGYPTYQWIRYDMINQNYVSGNQRVWAQIYGSNLGACTFLDHKLVSDCKVRNNLIYETFDGMWPHEGGAEPSEYAYNVFWHTGDDAIEFDSKTPSNLHVHHNFFLDNFVSLGLSPVLGGGLMIDHNIFYNSVEYGLPNSTVFKFHNPGFGPHPHRGWTIVHNTVVQCQFVLSWNNNKYGFEKDVLFDNNLFYAKIYMPWWPKTLATTSNNITAGPVIVPDHRMRSCIQATDPGFVSGPPIYNEALSPSLLGAPKPVSNPTRTPKFSSDWKPYWSEPVSEEQKKMTESGRMDFHLRENSPAVDAGSKGNDAGYQHQSKGSAPDLGAIELGDTWKFPRPGPRWAIGELTPWRPPLSPSLDPNWVGLGEPERGTSGGGKAP